MTDHTSGPIGHTHRDLNDTTGKNSILSLVREGMDVYDARNDHIGSVELVRFGAASESGMEHGTGSATPGRADSLQIREDSLIDNIAEAFDPTDMPEQLQERLLLSGFIRLDAAGLFASDRYITPDQISGVSDDKVQLTVERDQLIKRR